MFSQTIETELLAKRDALLKRIDAIKADYARGRSQDFAEQATETENDEVLHQLKFEAQAELQQINDALIRMKNNAYGLCAECGAPIPDSRLAALPYASLCVKCAEIVDAH